MYIEIDTAKQTVYPFNKEHREVEITRISALDNNWDELKASIQLVLSYGALKQRPSEPINIQNLRNGNEIQPIIILEPRQVIDDTSNTEIEIKSLHRDNKPVRFIIHYQPTSMGEKDGFFS